MPWNSKIPDLKNNPAYLEPRITAAESQLAEKANIVHVLMNVTWFGAIGDGLSHPLSEKYSTLAAGQAIYPHATSLTDEIDWCAIQKACNSGVKTVDLTNGNYIFNKQLLVPRGVTLIGVGEESIIDGRSITQNNIPVILSSGSVSSSTTLTSDVPLSSLTISVLSTTNISVGSWLLIRSTLDNSWSGTWGTANRTYRKQSFFQVKSISGNTVTLNESTNTTFESASTVVETLNPTTVKFANFKILVNSSNMAKGIEVDYGLNCLFENIKLIGGDIFGLNCSYSVRTSFDKCNVLLSATATSYQYGIDVGSSDLTFIQDCYINSTRHAVAIVGDQCRRIRVVNSTLIGGFPPDAHGNADDYVYEGCNIIGDNGIKIGGRNGTWKNCNVFCNNGTVILASEVFGGNFSLEGCTITSYSNVTYGAGWSPIDLGRGSASISADSRSNMLFKINNCKFTLPNLATFFIRLQNTSAYKVNMQMTNLIVDYPSMVNFIQYEGTPTAQDADFVIIDNITHNATTSPLPYFVQGSGATGYATTKIKYPIHQINGKYGFGTQSPEDTVHVVGGGIKVNSYASLTSINTSPYTTELKTTVTGSNSGQVNVTANARYGEIHFKTGLDGSALPLADRVVIESPGHTRPAVDNTQTLGTTALRWSNVYSFATTSSLVGLTPIASASAVNNSFFVDSADSILKFKNSTGVVKVVNLT